MQNKLKKGLFIALLSWVGNFSMAQTVITEVMEYVPAPGQFINTSIGGPNAASQLAGTGNGFVTLGACGGYIVLRFENPIENDPLNPYGIDFTLFGNATPSSSEPAVVWVMADSNQNHLPDEHWFLLAGSDYWFSASEHQYQITYHNPGSSSAADIPWTDNYGKTGFIFANEFHKQPYYPASDSFPGINQTAYALTGELINVRIDTSNPMLIVTQHYPFGYADNTPKNMAANSSLPDNPYTSALEGWGGDSFDISWAVDANGNYVDIGQIDFIKVQNAVNFNFGRIGEISTELTGIVDVSPMDVEVTDSILLAIEPVKGTVFVDEPMQLYAHAFKWGRLWQDADIEWSLSPNTSGVIDGNGLVTAAQPGDYNVYTRLASNHQISDSLDLHINEKTAIGQQLPAEIKCYPNPATSVINLKGYEGLLHFTILTVDGKKMVEDDVNNRVIDVSELAEGLYIMVLTNGQWHSKFTFIKN